MKKTMEVLRGVVLCLCFHQLTICCAATYPSKLELKVGLRLSVRDSFDDEGNLMPNTSLFSAAIPALNQAWFLPILATASFSSPNSSTSSESPPGFAFGFFFNKAPSQSLTHTITNIYLAVCGGLSGHNSSTVPDQVAQIMGIDDDPKGISLNVPPVRDGYAVPMWYANVTSLTSYNASLVVNEVAENNTVTKQLQLQDHDGTVFWKIRNAGLLEMQETGILVIYDAVNKTKGLWRSSRDTLFRGEKLNVSQMLTSIGSSYSARMDEGGIVLSLNTLQFMNEQPAPYWAVPLELLNSIHDPLNVSKQAFLKSACSSLQKSSNTSFYNINITNQVQPLSSPAYAMVDASLNFILSPGPCSSTTFLSMFSSAYGTSGSNASASGPLSFVKLKDDGWLHSYAVPLQLDSVQADIKDPYVLDVYESHASGDVVQKRILQLLVWDHCAIPNYCGPLSVCSRSSASKPCTCPSGQGTTFQAIDSKDPTQGCSLLNPLPHCSKDEHVDTTDFLQLSHTASIFLFSGWAFNSTPGEVPYCKSLCLANCYCKGFFYNFACFFITDEMSLLDLTEDTWEGISEDNVDIQPSNYVTYLKKLKSNLSSSTPAPPETSKSMTIAIATLLSFATCVGLGVALYVIRVRATKHRYRSKQAAKEEEELKDVLPLLPSRFSYNELHQVTKGFSELLGVGGCGSVYAGTLLDGTKVAVKALELAVKWQSKQFLAEVATIGRTSHYNVVRLVGFCWEVSNRLLVYEYMENGSLDQWLFIKARGMDASDIEAPRLDWQTRYNVVLGIARGLSYLHEDCPQPILHFDIKPQNILLDRAFVAKLADFGMSKLMQRDISEMVTGVRGTPGYIAPEWVSHGIVSKKSDIYSMGVVMLEIVGGRKNVDLQLFNDCDSSSVQIEEEWHFVSWAARKCEQGMVMDVVDRRLQYEYNDEQAQRLIYSAFWCIQEDPGMRPYVPTVVKWLEGSSPVPKPPFSSAAHSGSRSKPISSQRLSLTASTSSTPPPPST